MTIQDRMINIIATNTVLCTLNTQDNIKSTHKSFRRRLSASSVKTSRWCCLGRCAGRWWRGPPPPRPVCLHLSSWWCCPIPVVNYTFLHLCWGLGWGLWCIWPLSLLSQTIWALLSIPPCYPTPRNVGGDPRGCVWKPPRLSS